MKYKTIFFDLDDTLIDNNESLMYAFKCLIDSIGVGFSDELFNKWKVFDTKWWNSLETGELVIPADCVSREEQVTWLRASRFIKFFNDRDISFEEAVSLNQIYTSNLGENIVEIAGAKQLLADLSCDYEILIATNGPREAAVIKMDKAGFTPYISCLVSSEEIGGIPKPTKEFFKYLLSKCKNTDLDSMLIVGDSLSTDVLLGTNNGFDSCWFNPSNKEHLEECCPTYIVSNYNELISILKKSA